MQVHEANIAELYRMCNSPAMNSHAYAFGMDRKAILQRLIEDRYAGNQADFARTTTTKTRRCAPTPSKTPRH